MKTPQSNARLNVFGVVAVTRALLPLLRQSPAGRIVNVSSALGSLAMHSDPTSPIYDFKVPAYNVSKSAVNAWTAHLAYELRDTPIKVNAIHPGSVKTDMNSNGELDVVEGAKTSVAMALLDDAGVAALSGTAFGDFGEGYLRLSVANSIENIEKALDRVGAWVQKNL